MGVHADNGWQRKNIIFVYPPGYSVKPIEIQAEILSRDFGSIGLNLDVPRSIFSNPDSGMIPRNAEGLFILPWWKHLANSYLGALDIAVSLLGRKADIDIDIAMLSGIKRSRHTEDMLLRIAERQQSGVLVFPAQLGNFFRNIGVKPSDSSFLNEVDPYSQKPLYPNAFGLGIFEVLMILLSHPERLDSCYGSGDASHQSSDCLKESLSIDCSGDSCIDEIDWERRREVIRSAPYLFPGYGNGIELGLWPHYFPNVSSGIATGFMPYS